MTNLPGRNNGVSRHHRASASIEYVLVLFSMVMLGGGLMSTLGEDVKGKYGRIVYELQQAAIVSAASGTSGYPGGK